MKYCKEIRKVVSRIRQGFGELIYHRKSTLPIRDHIITYYAKTYLHFAKKKKTAEGRAG